MKAFYGIIGFTIAVALALLGIYYIAIAYLPMLFPDDSIIQSVIGSVLTLFLVPVSGIVGALIAVKIIYPRCPIRKMNDE